MDVISTTRYARISARKARDVAREIQGLPVSDALDLLTFTPRKAAYLIGKTVKTAMADAENNFELSVDSLVVKEATIGEGPTLRRYKPRARGSAGAIRKRTSHIRIVLTDDAAEEPEQPKKKAAAKKSTKKAAAKAAKEEAAPKKKAASKKKKQEAAGGGREDETLGLVYDKAPDEVDDLKQISGVGPALETKLNEAGIYTFAQIAGWKKAQVAAFDDLLSFKGRIERDEWIKRAKELQKEKAGG